MPVILLLLALQAAGVQPAARNATYVITSSGAVGDAQTSNTTKIQALIDKAASQGGGTIVVPRGTFLTGALFFKQGVNLRIEEGGVLKGSANPEDYPQVKTRWEGTDREWTAALLNFTNMTDVDVSGAGTVDGSGDEWLARRNAPPQGPRAGRPRMICFQSCKRVRIANL